MTDVFLDIDGQPNESLSIISERLEARSLSGQFLEFTKKYFEHTLDFLMLDKDTFYKIVDSFRQDHIWKKKGNKYYLRHNVNLDGTDD